MVIALHVIPSMFLQCLAVPKYPVNFLMSLRNNLEFLLFNIDIIVLLRDPLQVMNLPFQLRDTELTATSRLLQRTKFPRNLQKYLKDLSLNFTAMNGMVGPMDTNEMN